MLISIDNYYIYWNYINRFQNCEIEVLGFWCYIQEFIMLNYLVCKKKISADFSKTSIPFRNCDLEKLSLKHIIECVS